MTLPPPAFHPWRHMVDSRRYQLGHQLKHLPALLKCIPDSLHRLSTSPYSPTANCSQALELACIKPCLVVPESGRSVPGLVRSKNGSAK